MLDGSSAGNSDSESCVSFRARIRKSKRAIDPDFEELCRDTLVSFVAAADGGGPALALTPVPTVVPGARSLSRGKMRSMVAPGKRRLRSFGTHSRKSSTRSQSSSEASAPLPPSRLGDESAASDHDGLVEVSLEEEKDKEEKTGDNRVHHPHGKPAGLPRHPSPHPSSAGRYASPVPVTRTSSGVSGSQSDFLARPEVRCRSGIRSLSRSRGSRKRGGGGPRRMRSLGAASAFSTEGAGASSEMSAPEPEPVTIPLRDILSVDEQVPSRDPGNSSRADGGGAAKESQSASGGRRTLSPPPLSSGRGTPYRVFLHTLSYGYVEFGLDHANSYDIFMAYLMAHLTPDRLPQRQPRGVSAPRQHGGLRTMVLTPAKELPNGPSSATEISPRLRAQSQPHAIPSQMSRSSSTLSCNNIEKLQTRAIHRRLQNEATPLQRFREQLADWMSTAIDCACCQDTTTVTPLEEASSKGGGSLRATPPGGRKLPTRGGSGRRIETPTNQARSQTRSPTSERLRGKGIGGLSFEEMSCGTPKLSFERSVGGESTNKR